MRNKTKNNNVCCCESFLAFPNLDEANILAKLKPMMIGIQAIKMHFQIQGALML
jgi:hypothetical protein